jgi:hypothetical protein
MKLSEAYDKYNQGETFSICTNCKKAWIDDIPVVGIGLNCPTGDGFQIMRGVDDPAKYGCTLDDGSDLTPPIDDDPGKQARGIHQVRSKT